MKQAVLQGFIYFCLTLIILYGIASHSVGGYVFAGFAMLGELYELSQNH